MITKYSCMHDFLLFWNKTVPASDYTRLVRERYINKYIAPCLGQVELKQYNSNHIRKLKTYLIDNMNVTDSVYSRTVSIFRQAMMYAEEKLFIRNSFCALLKDDYDSCNKIRIFSPGEINTIFDALKYEELKNLFKIIFFTGMQLSEARAIQISNIDIVNQQLYINRRLCGFNNKDLYTVTLTNRQQIRHIYLSEEMCETIQDELTKYSSKRSSRFWSDGEVDYLFVCNMGKPYVYAAIDKAIKLVREITGITDFSIISLRYSAANAATKGGATEKDLQDLLGYTSLTSVYQLKSKFAPIKCK